MITQELTYQCIYCKATTYNAEKKLNISHKVCNSDLCRMELALDMMSDCSEEEFNSELEALTND